MKSRKIISSVINTIEGQVKCGKIERGNVNPEVPSGFTKVNVSTISYYSNIFRNLSPMIIGPVLCEEPLRPNSYYPDGLLPGYQPLYDETGNLKNQLMVCQTFERYWQGGKIYSKELKDGVLQKSFYIERGKMHELPKDDRRQRRRKYPTNEGFPISSMYHGIVMDYITSRKFIYIPRYIQLINDFPIYKALHGRVKQGENIFIVGPDGRDIPINEKSIKDALDDTVYPFGHELVICAMLKDIF